MKRFKNISLIALVVCAINTQSFAQTQKTISFEVEGLKVILRPTPKDVISTRLFVRGGTANYAKDKEGIEALAFYLAVNGGTTKMDKITFGTEAEKLGTTFGSATSLDLGDINMTCIKSFWDQSWNLYADAIMNPAFDEKEFGNAKEQMISGANQAESDPDSYLNILSMENAFSGRNYAKETQGSVKSLTGITNAETKKYYNTVGTPATSESKLLISKGSENIVDRDIATNYLSGIMSAPSQNSEDGVPMIIGMNILYDRFFIELRTKRSLSYAPAAMYNREAITSPYNMLYISTQKPKESMQVMIQIIDSIKAKGFKEKELVDKKQKFLTSTYMKLETSAAQSYALGRSEIIGSYTLDDKFAAKVSATNLTEVNRVFKNYTNAIKWTYLGKKDDVAPADFKQTIKTDFPSGAH